jgi:hypothetical protein
MIARRRSQSDLPNAPLELLHPLMRPGAEIPGAEIVREIAGRDGATLLELLRAVLTWSAHPDNAPDLESASLARMEYELLARGADAFASPAGLLAGYMANAAKSTARDIAWACVCISDWASERGARATALQFAQAAALAATSAIRVVGSSASSRTEPCSRSRSMVSACAPHRRMVR